MQVLIINKYVLTCFERQLVVFRTGIVVKRLDANVEIVGLVVAIVLVAVVVVICIIAAACFVSGSPYSAGSHELAGSRRMFATIIFVLVVVAKRVGNVATVGLVSAATSSTLSFRTRIPLRK